MRAVAEGQQFLTEKPPWELLPDCRAGSGCCTGGSLQGCSWIAGTQLGRPSPGTGPDTADVSRDLCLLKACSSIPGDLFHLLQLALDFSGLTSWLHLPLPLVKLQADAVLLL